MDSAQSNPAERPADSTWQELSKRPVLLSRVAFSLAAILAIYLIVITTVLPGVSPAKIIGAVAVIIFGAVSWTAHQPRLYAASAILLVSVALFGVSGASLTNGGVDGYVTPLIITGPIIAALFLGMRAALVATVGVIVMTATLLVVEGLGWVSETAYPPETTTLAAAALLATATLIAAAAVGAFAGDSRRLLADLDQARQEAEQASAAKSDFLSNMSHEMRTPLNGILGMAQLLESDELSPTQRDRVSVILQSGDALNHLIEDVLDLARIEAGRIDLIASRFILGDCVRDALTVVRGAADIKALSLDLDLPPELDPLECEQDYGRIRQVLVNLLGNAIKFTPEGHVRVSARFTGEGQIRITVTDTGPGVPPEQAGAIFERFVQGEAGLTKSAGGTGLGLAIAREIMTACGGALWLDQQGGSGAVFHMEFPQRLADTPADPASAGDSPSLAKAS